MTTVSRLAAAFAALTIQCVPAWAHHSVAAEFDTANRGELKGEITHVWFTNPHIRYRLTTRNEDGSTEDCFRLVASHKRIHTADIRAALALAV